MNIAARLKETLAEAKLHPDIASVLVVLAEEQDRLEAMLGRIIESAPAQLKVYILTGVTAEEQAAREEVLAKAEAESRERADQAARDIAESLAEVAALDNSGGTKEEGGPGGVAGGGGGGRYPAGGDMPGAGGGGGSAS